MSDVSSQPPTGETGPPGQAPAVPHTEMQAASGPSGPRAGFWQRFGATILDGILLFAVNLIIGLVLDSTVASLLSIVISFGYYTYFEGGVTGQTLGKRALGIRVIDFNTGGPIGYGRAFLRAVVEIFSGLVILLGFLWMLWDREKQTWHDKAANSVVVPASSYPVQR